MRSSFAINLRTTLHMLLVIATAFLLRRSFTEGAPLALSACPTELPVHVRDDPISTDDCNNRTIWNILWSCLATTFTCTWLSVHPNVPFKNEGKWAILGRRLFLMFFSILAPEVMVMWAFKQWRGAVMIKEIVNKAKPESCTSRTCKINILFDIRTDYSAEVDDEARLLPSDGRIQTRVY